MPPVNLGQATGKLMELKETEEAELVECGDLVPECLRSRVPILQI